MQLAFLVLLGLLCLQTVEGIWQVPASFAPVHAHSKHAHKGFFQMDGQQRTLAHHQRSLLQKNGVAQLNTLLYKNFILIANVSVGTPAQAYCIEFFYGSSDLWLIHPSAKVKKNDTNAITKRYNSTLSSTYTADGRKMSADSGYVKGIYGSDWVTIGGQKVNMTFGVANSIGSWLYYRPVEGEFGLNYETPSSGVPSAMAQVLNQTDQPIFSFFFRGATQKGGDGSGVLTFGGEDKTTCEDKYVYPEQSNGKSMWFKVKSIKVGSDVQSPKNVNITLTVWSNYFYTSKNVTQMIANAAGAVWNSTLYANVVDCNNKNASQPVDFDVGGGNTLSMTVGDFILKTRDGMCILAVQGYMSNDDSQWYLPKIVLKNRCVAINMQSNKLGWSNLRQTNSARLSNSTLNEYI